MQLRYTVCKQLVGLSMMEGERASGSAKSMGDVALNILAPLLVTLLRSTDDNIQVRRREM